MIVKQEKPFAPGYTEITKLDSLFPEILLKF
jgi:hypothetical protein